jgi:hypothetical protein
MSLYYVTINKTFCRPRYKWSQAGRGPDMSPATSFPINNSESCYQ